MKHFHVFRKQFMFLGTALVVFGCSQRFDNDVQERYSRRVRELGLNAVYPPREEFQVGDVYINSENVRDPADVIRVQLGSIPYLLVQAQKNLDGRLVFVGSGEKAKEENAAGQVKQDDLVNGGFLHRSDRKNANVNTLPITGIPSITADAGLSANVGIASLLSSIGLLGGGRTSVTLDFNDVRTYWAPVADAEGYVRQEMKAKFLSYDQCSRFINLLSDTSDPRLQKLKRNFSYSVVTRVYLTRSINYTYRNTSILAFAQKQNATVGSGKTGAFSGATIIVNNTGTDGKTADPSAQLTDAVATLNKQTEAGGTGFQFGGFNQLGLTLTRTFQQPVAVAWEGFTYNFDASNPECQRAVFKYIEKKSAQ